MEKRDQFLAMVQTAILTKYVCDPGDSSLPMSRPMWAIEHMDDALKVAERIPPDVTAREAAEAFVRWMFHEDLTEDERTVLEILVRGGL